MKKKRYALKCITCDIHFKNFPSCSAALTLLEHVNNACVDCCDKLQDKVHTPLTTTFAIYHNLCGGCVIQRFTAPVNILDRLSVSMTAPAMIVSLLPGHEGYSVALGNNNGNTGG